MKTKVVIVEQLKERSKSAIDQLGIGERVLMLRRNLTLEEVADRINKEVPEGTPRINEAMISRYCKQHGLEVDNRSNRIDAARISYNSLAEAVSVKERVARHVRKLEKIVDKIKDDKEKLSEIASISNAYLHSCKVLQDVNMSISKIQKEHFGHEKVRKVLKALLAVLEEYPEVKIKFFEKLRESAVYDTIKYI